MGAGGVTVQTKYYFNNYERIEYPNGARDDIFYIWAEGNLAAIVKAEQPAVITGTIPTKVYYPVTDHLGSITHLFDDEGMIANGLVEERSFDAWGNPRDPNTLAVYGVASGINVPKWKIDRGYTGQEHIWCEINNGGTPAIFDNHIVNLNGRLYDPQVARMFSPDPFIPNATNSQDYNKYSYARNNPLKYSDPDGEWVNFAIGAVVGGFTGYQIGKTNGAKGWSMVGYIAGGAGIGAATAGVGTLVSGAVGANLAFAGAGAVGAAAGGATAGAVGGFGMTMLAGKTLGDAGNAAWKGAIAGFVGGAVGSYIGGGWGAIAGGGIAGGVGSALNGGNGEDIAGAALMGAVISWGSYNIQQEAAYRRYNNGGRPMGNLKRSGYRRISTATQRSFARGKEAGGWILDDGSVGKVVYGKRGSLQMPEEPTNGFAEWHTHPNDNGAIQTFSDVDIWSAKTKSFVIGWKNLFSYDPATNPWTMNDFTLIPNTDPAFFMPNSYLYSTYKNGFNSYPAYLHIFGK